MHSLLHIPQEGFKISHSVQQIYIKLNEFMNKIYIENVWCFGKDKSFDLFRHTKSGTLEAFL